MTRMLDRIDELASRYVYKACDAVMTADVAAQPSTTSPRGHVSRYRRVHDLAAAAKRRAPALMAFASRRLQRFADLPVPPSRVELLSFGSGSTVFLLHHHEPAGGASTTVLKVLRRSLGRRTPVLLQQMQEYQARYRQVCAWYDGLALIVPLYHLILNGPVLGLRCVAVLQPYVGGVTRDFFEHGSDEATLALVRRHPVLREQFCGFAERTLAVVRARGLLVDIVGRDNLLVVPGSDGPRLQLIDYGVLVLPQVQVHSPPLYAAACERIARLERLHQQLVADDEVTVAAPLAPQEA